MPYRIAHTPEAEQEFKNLPRHIQKRVQRWYDLLAEDPRRSKTSQLEGYPHLRRVHASKAHVIVYTILQDQVLVLIVRVAHRSQVYRRLPGA